jgi:hypothetical protein
MTTEKFEKDLALARRELAAATAEVMAFVRAGRAFGEHWKAAVERERKAHKQLQWVINSPLVPSVGGKPEP